jgi:acetoacetate decarboxylase
MSPMLKGFCYPFTPQGKSQLVSPPPWYFSVDQMIIHYNADVEQVKRYIPDPMSPSLNATAGCTARITNMMSVSEDDKEMMFINPERCNFKEGLILNNCSYNGEEGQKISYMWVDNDFTLMRGWFMGAPKKLGRIHSNFDFRQLYEINSVLDNFGTGTRLKGWVESHGERVMDAGMTIGKKITPDKMPSVLRRETFNILHYPNIEIGATKPLVHRIVTVVADIEIGELWEGKDANLILGESEIEEHTDLKPLEVTNAYFMSFSLTIHGVKQLYDYNK